MKKFDTSLLKQLYRPPVDSHKGQNGKLLLIGGSKLFHTASLWPLTIASRIVDMVYYSSVSENNAIVQRAKEEFRNGIVVLREHIDDYIGEADCVLIGPGLPREEGQEAGDDDTKELTERLIKKYPHKKWVVDGGSLQEMDPEVLLELKIAPILTPHAREFEMLFQLKTQSANRKTTRLAEAMTKRATQNLKVEEIVKAMARKYKCVILLKGQTDIVCSSMECVYIEGGNAGMAKGGTGDVLAGLVAALYCKNDAFLSAACASYINKKAGESLFQRVGYYFNASDLADEIPKVMKQLLL